jgi:putative ABC transport system substrate-binding protein
MHRRELLALLGGAAVTRPFTAHAQQSGKMPTVGFLGSGTAAAGAGWAAAFAQGLRELGWIEGRTVSIEYRWAEGRNERVSELAAELVGRKVDVILTDGNTAATSTKQATKTVPIVFAAAGDPVGTGLVASLAQPGANVTGLSIQQTDLAGKRLELMREPLSKFDTLAILVNSGSPNAMLEMDEAQVAARQLGLAVVRSEVQRLEDFANAIGELKGRAEALYVCSDPLLTTNRVQISNLALLAQLPAIYGFREYAEAGGLMSYGPHFPDLFRRAANYVDKILRGTRPADLPVQQPTKFELVINMKTAKGLGLTISPTLLARADEVIE